MISLWKTWFAVLWKSEHLWAYYLVLIALFISQLFFTLNEQMAMIPFYGLFISVMTLIILRLHNRFHMKKIVRSMSTHPFREGLHQFLFCGICALPAIVLLFVLTKRLYAHTPNSLLIYCIVLLTLFAITFACACAILPFNYAMICCVLVYFILFVMHGYQLERIVYIAPTLNFMYPDYPNISNMIAVTLVSIIMFCIYLRGYYDWEHNKKILLYTVGGILIISYLFVPFSQWQIEKKMVAANYKEVDIQQIPIRYKGISEKNAIRYGQVVTDIIEVIRQRGIKVDVEEVVVTWQNDIPAGPNVEHIIEKQGGSIMINPYSPKFLDFNYGYNIVRDLIGLFVENEKMDKEIERQVMLENKNHLFTQTKINSIVHKPEYKK